MGSVWEEVRGEFPALRNFIYLNAAAASPTPRSVAVAVGKYYREFETGGDILWGEWLARREAIRSKVAALVGADADEIAFTSNTSTGMNLIVDLLASSGAVLSDEIEFPTVTLPWIHRGVSVHFVPAVEGVPRLESFAVPDAPKAATIAISHVQFSNGCRLDLSAFGALKAHRHLVVSGSQGIGAFPVDVRASRIDALATAGHKWLCAGYGTGFVYVSRQLLQAFAPRQIGWMSVKDPFGFDNRNIRLLAGNRRTEMGCPAFAGIFALGAAVDHLLALGVAQVAERILALNLYLTYRLERSGIPVLSPLGEHRSGQTLLEVKDPPRAAAFLRERGILVTEKPQGLRVSTHYYNSEEEVDRCVAALQDYLGTA